jgi:N-acetylglucosamine-6-sulfatase
VADRPPEIPARRRTPWAARVAWLIALLGLALGSTSLTAGRGAASSPAAALDTFLPVIARSTQPNFLIIISDDQRYDTMDFMPITKARIFDRGVTFSNAFATTPLCCPSRSSILSGQYALHHHVYTNFDPLYAATFVQRLHDAGYLTGLVGKYLNSWDGTRRPEFDWWVVFAGHGSAQRYWDPLLNVNGAWTPHSGYMTPILRDYALGFLAAARQSARPFVLVFAPNAPHEPADPAPGDEQLYKDLPPHRPPSYMEDDVSDKPNWLQQQPPADPAYVDSIRKRQLRTLWSLDGAIGTLLDALESSGLEETTVVMYLSDNGFFWGEHRLTGKIYAYSEAARIPLAIRYDPLIAQPRIESRLVANVDLAPTLYELAGLTVPPDVDGRSLAPLLKQQSVAWRDALLLEGWGYYPYMALRTGRYLYIETDGDSDELYDTLIDPHEVQNRHDDPEYAAVVADLRQRLGAYKAQARPPDPSHLMPRVFTLFGWDD